MPYQDELPPADLVSLEQQVDYRMFTMTVDEYAATQALESINITKE